MPKAGQRVSEYVLIEKIGQGGFGEVWKARHHLLDGLVAVKIPTDPASVDSLRAEGRIQHSLRHPAIVQTLGVDPEADPPYLVLEYVEGGSLRDLLRARGALSLTEALEIARQVLEALAFAHRQGVVHRDLKPENILLAQGTEGSRRRARVADFGLGRPVSSAESLRLSGAESVANVSGTLDYMAPEQRRGGPADARSDVYSFGLVFYEMLAGELPVGAFRFPSEIFPDIPKRIDDFLRRCLAPAAADRYASCEEALDALSGAGDPEFQQIDSGIEFRRGEALALPSGGEVFTLRELTETMLAKPEEARLLLPEPRLEAWLRHLREKDLARRAAEIRTSEPDLDVAVQKFLEATGMVAAPKLDLDTMELSVGAIVRGTTHTIRLNATAIGKGILYGEARVDGAAERVFFKGKECPIEFTISTSGMSVGERRTLAVLVESNGGRARVPVHFAVAPRPARLASAAHTVEIVCRGRRGVGTVRVRNDGDEPLSLSASWNADWLDVGQVRDIPGGGEAFVEFRASLDRVAEAPHLAQVALTSNGGSLDVAVRARRIRRFSPWGFLFGLLVGIVPFVAEFLIVVLAFDQALSRGKGPGRFSFLLGLLPGVIVRVAMLLHL